MLFFFLSFFFHAVSLIKRRETAWKKTKPHSQIQQKLKQKLKSKPPQDSQTPTEPPSLSTPNGRWKNFYKNYGDLE